MLLVIPLPFGRRLSRQWGRGIAVAGGLLILADGLLISPYYGGLAEVAVIEGLAIIVLAASDASAGRFQQLVGAAIVVISLISFLTVSGFGFGAILGSIGGTILVLAPSFAPGSYSKRGKAPKLDLGPPCPACGRPIPPWTTTCPYCASSP